MTPCAADAASPEGDAPGGPAEVLCFCQVQASTREGSNGLPVRHTAKAMCNSLRAKTTKAPHGPGAIGALGRRLDPVNQRISSIDIHPRICIGQAIMSGGHVENPMLAAIACPLRHLPRARNA